MTHQVLYRNLFEGLQARDTENDELYDCFDPVIVMPGYGGYIIQGDGVDANIMASYFGTPKTFPDFKSAVECLDKIQKAAMDKHINRIKKVDCIPYLHGVRID